MNKTEIIREVASAMDSKKDAQAAVDCILKSITKALQRKEPVTVSGFGTFTISKRNARTGINPRTGERMQIAAKVVPRFKPAKALSDALN